MRNKIFLLKLFIGTFIFIAGMFSFAHGAHAFSLTFNVTVKYDSDYPFDARSSQTFNLYIQKSSSTCTPTVLMESVSSLPPCGVLRTFSITMPANSGPDSTSSTYSWTYTSATAGTYYVNEVQRIGWSAASVPFWSSFSATGTYNVNYINIYRPQMCVGGIINQTADTVSHTWDLQVEEWNGTSWIGAGLWSPRSLTLAAGATTRSYANYCYNFNPGRHRIRLTTDTAGWSVTTSTSYSKYCNVAARNEADYAREIYNQVTGPISSKTSPEFNFVWESYRQGNYPPYEYVLFTQRGNVTFNLTKSTYTVSTAASPAAGGTFSPTSASVTPGSSTSFTVSASAGYSLTGITDNCSATGTQVGTLSGNTYTLTPARSCTVTATYGTVSYSVSSVVNPTGGGTFNPTSRTVAGGSSTNFTITPAVGYGLNSVTDNCSATGTQIGTLGGTTYTINPVTRNCTVTAIFDSKKVTCFLETPDTVTEKDTNTPVIITSPGTQITMENMTGYTVNWHIDWGDSTDVTAMSTKNGVTTGDPATHVYTTAGERTIQLILDGILDPSGISVPLAGFVINSCPVNSVIKVNPTTEDNGGEVAP